MFWCLGRVRAFHFLLFGRVDAFCFLPFWEGAFFFAVWAGTGVESLTGLPGWALRGLTTKKTKQQTKTGSQVDAEERFRLGNVP